MNNPYQALRCPATGQDLELMSRQDAEAAVGHELVALRTNGHDKAKPVGPTTEVLVRQDRSGAYPIVDETPVLLTPEVLGDPDQQHAFDLASDAHEEAYLEMDFYNGLGAAEAANIEESEGFEILRDLVDGSGGTVRNTPEPRQAWLDARFDSHAQADVYEVLAPFTDRCLAQIGGKGIHAVKMLLGGASIAYLVTPMLGEAQCARALAKSFGVDDKLLTVVGVAEEMPLKDEVLDGVFVGGSVHHMSTPQALPEIARTLKSGGSFGAVEPFRGPLYGIGTSVFGKREPNAHCSPMDGERIAPLAGAFSRTSVQHHGALTRYALLGLWKLGLTAPFGAAWRIGKADDWLTKRLSNRLHETGSSIALLGWKD